MYKLPFKTIRNQPRN